MDSFSKKSINSIHIVSSFNDLIKFPFQGENNAVIWKRQLKGDFLEIIRQFDFTESMIELQLEDLEELTLTEHGQMAREILLEDFNLLKEIGALPTLNIIKNYERDSQFPFFPTDVYSFHVDRSPIPVDTILCTYYGQSSDILPNSAALQKILLPEIRSELRKLFEGDDQEFENFLVDYFFDLHYQEKSGIQPISVGTGNICRLATDHPDNPALPCIHRAPDEKNGQPRLLMIC